MAASFIIYTDSSNVVNMLTDMEAGLLFKAILAYQSGGEYEPIVKAGGRVLAMAFEHFRQYFVRDAEKYQNVTEARREAAKKRWEQAKQCKPMQSNAKNANAQFAMQSNANDADNDNNNDSVNDNDSVNVSVLTCNNTPTPQTRHDRFLQWLTDNCPYIAGHYKLPSAELLDKLIAKYGAEQVAEQCLNIENRTDLRKRYTNLYQTLNNWCKRETELNQKYGTDRKYNQEGRAERAEGVAQLLQRLAAEDDQRTASASIQPHSVA